MLRYKLIFVNEAISSEDFARQAGVHASQIREYLQKLKIPEIISLINAEKLAQQLQNVKIINSKNIETKIASFKKIIGKNQKIPVISIMGHIDHGKTTVVDQIMKTHFVDKEAGGITQNISLYKIKHKDKEFFLIDTPGHKIFSDIREFILKNTDILLLIVSADDGVSEQTEEILKQSIDVEKIICINKIDKFTKNPEQMEKITNKIYHRLSEFGVLSNEYGGEVLTCKISAKTGEGLENLIESIFLKTDFMDFSADPKQEGLGYVLDSYVKKGIGFVTRVLLKTGTIQTGDKFLYNTQEGLIKKILVNGNLVTSASFNDLIDIIGFTDAPEPGKEILIINEDSLRKDISLFYSNQIKNTLVLSEHTVNFILKTDNVNHLITLEKEIQNKGKIVQKSIGDVSDSEITTGRIFKCVFVLWGGFSQKTLDLLKSNNLKFICDPIIYNVLDQVDLMLAKPKEIEYTTMAKARVLKVFHIDNMCIAGCRVLEGTIKKGNLCRVMRNDAMVSEGRISSMKREKNTIAEAATDSECGIIINKQFEYFVGDEINIIEEKKE